MNPRVDRTTDTRPSESPTQVHLDSLKIFLPLWKDIHRKEPNPVFRGGTDHPPCPWSSVHLHVALDSAVGALMQTFRNTVMALVLTDRAASQEDGMLHRLTRSSC